jgi:hypothetical protein
MRKDLLDEDGENRAVRSFLMLYGGAASVTIGQMRDHLAASGWDCWPAWAGIAAAGQHLTKGSAQAWLRCLFDLENTLNEI